MGVLDLVGSLLQISTYQRPPQTGVAIDSNIVDQIRKALGGQLSPMPQTRLRWYLADLEAALGAADTGNLDDAAQLWRAMKRDAILSGVLSTLTSGLVGLPKRWSGDAEIVAELEGRDGVQSVFDNMCPPGELALLAGDGFGLGVAVGELVEVKGRDYPVLVRHDPQWLFYKWNENQWYFRSIAGLIPVTPGDGRWVLHIDGGRIAPWQSGRWFSLGQSWIQKQHAALHKANWEAKLANPARVAVSPQGASEAQKQSWFQQVMAWGVNSVFGLTPGYDVKLLESNGRGYESWVATIAQSDKEIIIGIGGQIVTVDGGAGFQNSDIHRSIRADVIKGRAEALAHTLSTQVIPQYTVKRHGAKALARSPALEWDTKPPKDIKESAEATGAFGDALGKANAALQPYGRRVDAIELSREYGLPLERPPIEVVEAEPEVLDAGTSEPDAELAAPDEDLADETAYDDELAAQVGSIIEQAVLQ